MMIKIGVLDFKDSVLLLIFPFFFHQSGMARAGLKSYRCQTQLHQLTQASAKVGNAYM